MALGAVGLGPKALGPVALGLWVLVQYVDITGNAF